MNSILIKNPKTGEDVELFIPMHMRNLLPSCYKNIQDSINQADIETARKLKVSIALQHLEEQEKKGHVLPNGEKGPGFEKHTLPEINAILYNFHYDATQMPESS